MEARTTPGLKPARVFALTPIGILGGVLALISCLVLWGPHDDSFGVPRQFLWDAQATGGVKLGVPLVS